MGPPSGRLLDAVLQFLSRGAQIGSPGGDHVHGTHEIFYVLSGTMEHIVNGESAILEPGMIGIVRKGDTVSHKILSDEPVKALVIWAPGGEAERLAQFFTVKPIE